MRVNLASWYFEYLHDTPRDIALRENNPLLVPEPESFDFRDTGALLQHLDGPGDIDRSRFQRSIGDQLKEEPNVKDIHETHTPLKHLKHFSAYRGKRFGKYHEAARRVAGGGAVPSDRKLVDGLDSEIAASKISLDAGQILFHGRCNDLLVRERPYASYVSTTLDPIVALNSAYRRAGNGNVNGRPIVFVLELCLPLRALWGHVGKSAEWELLLPRGVDWKETKRRCGNSFDVVHAVAPSSPVAPDSSCSAGVES